MPITIGTSHFLSKDSAVRYYASQWGCRRAEAAAAVDYKLRDGEIHIGPPSYDRATSRLLVDPVEGRYKIVEERP